MHRSIIPWLLVVAAATAARGDETPAKFFRGLNLNGPALSIDGHAWEGQDAKNYTCRGDAFENQSVALQPRTDSARAKMLRGSRWGHSIDVELTEIPPGAYQVFLYVWEDNDSETFDVLLDDRVVLAKHKSGATGHWDRLGPWRVDVKTGTIRIGARGGAANLSGIEVWSGRGAIPAPAVNAAAFVQTPTSEQLEFFERKIRPLLADRCYECHSAESKQIGGDLLLDSRVGLIKGGAGEPAIVPGDPDASLLMTAVRYDDPSIKMPPSKSKRLSPAEIEDLAEWIRIGAPDPRTGDTTGAVKKYAIDWEAGRQFWSFQPLANPDPPIVKDISWPVNEIDRFILARLEAAGITPAELADKRTLLRRVTYDLTGLPPTPEELEAFLADSSQQAIERVVDRLLASPQYGERWGRHWLDVVRYADTAGDNSDFPIPQMYRYRNWVIEALNRDMPYDQFVREQLAGDLLPTEDPAKRQSRLIATGYIANARRFGSRVDDYPQHLTIEDTLDNLGRAFLGLSVNCARCHDHKFDPISTQDYYALYGIFSSTRYPWPGIELEQQQRDLVPLVSADEAANAVHAKRERQSQLEGEVKRLEKERDGAEGDRRKELEKAVDAARKEVENWSRTALPFEQAYAVIDASKIEDARVQPKGDPLKSGAVVHRRFLTVLGGAELPTGETGSGRRQLAEWIVDPANPLTARVMANRVWLQHFGQGIVPTPNDFGRQGRPPSHPELLDWLAGRFIASGWSLKSLHRLIVLSRTYQLSSQPTESAQGKDPGNELLAYAFRRRLDAESLRDTLLVLGGNLDRTPAGPHPFPPQTEWRFTQHNPFKAVYDSNRRSVYLMTQRIQRHPFLAIFDGADTSASTARRLTSTTPLQALYLLNDPFTHEQAHRLSERLRKAAADDATRIDLAWRLVLGREGEESDRQAAMDFLSSVKSELGQAGVAPPDAEGQAWDAFVRSLFRLNEFVYID